MIRLTLYKNCILNDSYKNLFYTEKALPIDDDTVLDTYLNSLTKLIINNEQISNTYQENTGTMVFSFENATNENIYDFNYMKIEWRILNEQGEPIGTWLKRYCFIDDVRIKNDVAYFDYSEDVFSSFVNSNLKTDVFKLSRHRFLGSYHNSEPVKLPIDYEGNDKLVLGSYSRVNDQKYMLLATIQWYRTKASGEVSDPRETSVVQLCKVDTSTTPHTITYDLTFSEIEDITKNAVTRQAEDRCYIREPVNTPPKYYYYQIADFIVLPKWQTTMFERPNISDISYFKMELAPLSNAFVTQSATYHIGCLFPSSIKMYSLQLLTSIAETYNYKTISIGTINTQIPVVNNKTTIKGEISAYLTGTSFNIYLNCMNTFIDVTKDFIYEVPFTSVLGEENQALQTTRALKSIGYVLNMGKGMFDFNSAIDKAGGYSSQIKALKFTPTGKVTTSQRKWNKIRALQKKQTQEYGDVIESGIDVIDGISGFINTNKPTYSSINGTFGVSDAFINAYYGFAYTRIDPDNEDYVTKSINESGYETFKYEDSLNDIGFFSPTTHTTAGCKWDIYKFEDITIFGAFPRDIGKKLEQIFSNGFKLFYVPQEVSSDTYTLIL